MAAYLAGMRGTTRDAVTVGATVTATHTAGVLIIGLCLTTFSSLAGDTVLNWLGVASGGLVALVGAALLVDAARRSRRGAARTVTTPEPELVGAPHSHSPVAAHASDHSHSHAPEEQPAAPPQGHDHPHGHTHPHATSHRHGLLGHRHSHAPAAEGAQPFTTRGLVGLGVAGGLVPSPSAPVVLLGAIALGRTYFGAALVLAYGLGMAATLTAVGLLFVRLGGRLNRLTERPMLRLLRRLAPYTAPLTALLVIGVGLGLMARSLPAAL